MCHRFGKVPKDYWHDIKNQRRFLDWATKELKIKSQEDWYNVKAQDVIKLGGSGLILHYGSWAKTLISVYPEYRFNIWR